MLRLFKLVLVLAVIPSAAMAQGNAVVNPAYRRAQTLVNDGNAIAGRALVDSMIGIAALGSTDYAEGVYWRAILDYFAPAVQLGLTATPKRRDNVDTYAYFGEPVFTIR